jgi:mannosyltransferase
VPTIQTTYDLPITSKTPKKLELGGLFFVDHVICTSEFIREYLAKVGIPTGNAVVIPYGIEDVWFPLSKSHFVESGGIEVLFFGDAKAERGTDVLLKSISKVAESHSDVHFTFAIREHEPACVERLKKLSGLYPIKILLRDNRHISEVASQGDIIVLPYLLTTMQPPLTLIEGMLLGKAVITTDVEANREFIGANQRGLLIEPSNVEALVQALDLLLSDPGKRRNLGTSASQFILEIYNWDEVVQKIFSLYRYCLDGTTTGND